MQPLDIRRNQGDTPLPGCPLRQNANHDLLCMGVHFFLADTMYVRPARCQARCVRPYCCLRLWPPPFHTPALIGTLIADAWRATAAPHDCANYSSEDSAVWIDESCRDFALRARRAYGTEAPLCSITATFE